VICLLIAQQRIPVSSMAGILDSFYAGRQWTMTDGLTFDGLF
jgi:hypothetical protein